MSTDVLSKDLSDRRTTMAIVVGVLVVLTIFALAIASVLEESTASLSEGFPDSLNAFIPSDVPGGYAVGEVINLIAPLVLVGYAVMTGASATAGEEQAGTMAVLIAQPVSRHSLLVGKAVGLLFATIGIIVIFGVATAFASATFDVGLAYVNILATCVHLLLLATLYGSISLALGAMTGNPSIAAGGAGAFAVISYVANAMLPLAGFDD